MMQILLFPILPRSYVFYVTVTTSQYLSKTIIRYLPAQPSFEQAKEMAKGDLKLLQHRFRSLVRGCEAVYRERLKAEKEYEEGVGR
jgi:hypothetical protein